MAFQGVIFDVDGTLVDSNDAHAQAFVEAFRAFGHEVAFERVRRLIGKGSDKLIPEIFGRYDERIAERKKAIFKARHLASLRAFPGVAELLGALRSRGLKLAVATSKREPTPTPPSAPSPIRTSCKRRSRDLRCLPPGAS